MVESWLLLILKRYTEIENVIKIYCRLEVDNISVVDVMPTDFENILMLRWWHYYNISNNQKYLTIND
jgi:hypothetical protein